MGRIGGRPSPQVLLADGRGAPASGRDGAVRLDVSDPHRFVDRASAREGEAMSHPDKLQQRIDAYLMQLRRSLGELPPDEVNEILQEIRGHILERTEASGELTDERLVEILKALGSPDEIAPLYQADALMARARASLSPRVV